MFNDISQILINQWNISDSYKACVHVIIINLSIYYHYLFTYTCVYVYKEKSIPIYLQSVPKKYVAYTFLLLIPIISINNHLFKS